MPEAGEVAVTPEVNLGQFLRGHLQVMQAVTRVATTQEAESLIVRPGLIEEELLGTFSGTLILS